MNSIAGTRATRLEDALPNWTTFCSRGLAAALVAISSIAAAQTSGTPTAIPPGPAHDLVVARCSKCHDLGVLSTQPHSADEWADLISTMIDRGAQLTDAEFDEVHAYLIKAFPTSQTPIADSPSAGVPASSSRP